MRILFLVLLLIIFCSLCGCEALGNFLNDKKVELYSTSTLDHEIGYNSKAKYFGYTFKGRFGKKTPDIEPCKDSCFGSAYVKE